MNIPQCVLDKISKRKSKWIKEIVYNRIVYYYKNTGIWITENKKRTQTLLSNFKYEYSYYSFYGIIREDISLEEAQKFVLNKVREYLTQQLKELE
jgi:hypothetical protein